MKMKSMLQRGALVLASATAVVGGLSVPASAAPASPMAWWHQAYYAQEWQCIFAGGNGTALGRWDAFTCQENGPSSTPWNLIVEQ